MNKSILPLFWATLGVFVFLIMTMFAPLRLPMGFVPFLFPAVQALFFILGLALLILSIRAKLDKMYKRFLILSGASVVGIVGSMIPITWSSACLSSSLGRTSGTESA